MRNAGLAAAVCLLVAGTVAGCGGAANSGAPAAGSGGTSQAGGSGTTLTFVTDFGLYGRQAFAYVAQKQGFFKQQGLNVSFQPGQGSADAVKQVAVGRAQFGFADTGTLVQSLGQQSLPVKLLGVVYQKPAQAIFALASSGITKPSGLAGKTIAAPAGSAVEAMFPLWARSVGVDPSSVHWVNVASNAIPQLLASHRVAAVEQFVVGKPLLTQATHGAALAEFSYQNLGLYGNGIIANGDYLSAHPGIAKRFMKAIVEGMHWAFAHPKQAGIDTHAFDHTVNPVEAAQEDRIVAKLATTAATRAHGLGYIDPSKLTQTITLVAKAFKLPSTPTVKQIYAPGYLPTGS